MTLQLPDWSELGLDDEAEWWPSLPEDWDESGFAFAYTSADWQDQGLCGQTDPEAFFPERGHQPDAAKRICAGCPVRAMCLDWALATGDKVLGVWGGLTEAERRPLRRARPCGLHGCENPRGFGADGSRRKYCSDQCLALARIENRDRRRNVA